MRYLVTGAAGFIGYNVVAKLLDGGDEVVGADNINDAYDVRLKDWRLRQLTPRDGFTFQRADISDLASISSVFTRQRFDAVINLAARAGVRYSVENPWVYMAANSQGTLNLLDLCVKHDVPKFVLSSTSSLYGGDNPRPYEESSNTDRPLSPYAASKKAAEVMCYTYHYMHGIDVTVLRYFTVYGPAGRPDMSPFRFVQWIFENRPVTVFGDGQQERDFTYVEDVALGSIAALKPLGYEVVNLGGDRPTRLIDMIRLIEELTGKGADLRFAAAHKADMRATWASVERARQLLVWRPRTSLRDGMRRLVEWYAANRDWASQIDTRG